MSAKSTKDSSVEVAKTTDADIQGLIDELRTLAHDASTGKTQPKKAERKYKAVTVQRHEEGTILLPVGMGYAQAREWLTKIEKDEEQAVDIHYDFDAFPLDGAYAFWRALKGIYGFVDTHPTWWSQTTMVNVEVAPGEYVPVPWGDMQPPGMDAVLSTGMDFNGEVPKFVIHGQIRKKNQKAMDLVAAETRRILREESIYQGQAIRVNLAFMMGEERFNPDRHAPKYINFGAMKQDDLIVDHVTETLLITELWARIEQTEKVRAGGAKIKHGVIFSGKFGTGKTLAAMVTAMKAVATGDWTYMYLDNANQLPVGIKLAKLFGPTIVFAEDIDASVEGQQRTDLINMVLNAIDGMDNKGQDLLVVLTTNDVEAINNGFLRAGRTDGIIHFKEPDGPTSRRFLERVLGSSLKAGEDIEKLGDVWAGVIPAFLREAADKARMIALMRTGEIKGQVTVDDLLVVREAMAEHIKMVTGEKPARTISVAQMFNEAQVTLEG